MKIHPILHVSFETTKLLFTQILHHCVMSRNITPLYFFSSNLYTLGKINLQTFEWLGKSSTVSLRHAWNFKSVFLKTLCHSSVSWEITLLYLFSWNCTWFGQKEPIKVQNFRLLTCSCNISKNLYFDRLLLLKVYKFQLKKNSNINEGIKAVLLFKRKKMRAKVLDKLLRSGKLAKVSSYIPNFTNLLNPSGYCQLTDPTNKWWTLVSSEQKIKNPSIFMRLKNI